jgi:threonine dehydrogenase-like Zn-dependent dehydrogenase
MDEFPVPSVGEGDALLRVEVCGICGSDVEFFNGTLGPQMGIPYPFIPGHEPVGVIEEIGDEARRRWHVGRGDRVAVEAAFRCGSCRNCILGSYRLCTGTRPGLGYGHVPTSVAPSIWGAYGQMIFLNANTILHKVPEHVAPELAVLYQPLGGGIRWASHVPGTKRGDTVVILGPGQRGLACVIAARQAGAELIIISGTAADTGRLELARDMGADVTVDVSQQDVVEVVSEVTSGAMADVVVDMSAGATGPVVDAIHAARVGGTVVLAGMKGGKAVPNFVSDDLINRQITLVGVQAVDYPAYAEALEIIASGRYPLERMHTHDFPLEQAERAIRVLAREVSDGVDPVSVALRPNAA